ncbi:hypothetical protein EHS25_001710 [Saitozyma podzolica]|uniref:Uncharacterized protein n=1 Tax=Saitozyma podzolica TaxID=1890683 RepID=A0A427YEX2_9TREE|nr:hypothetical protein EHS25_001710 [Saitozyma podzolica]
MLLQVLENNRPTGHQYSIVLIRHRTVFSRWAYEPDPRFARESAPSPEPEDQELDRAQNRSGNRYGLVTSASNEYGLVTSTSTEYEVELHDFVGRPNEPNFSPSDVRLPQWPSSLSPHALADLAAPTSSNDEPSSWTEALNSLEAEQWQAAAEAEMRSLEKAKVFDLVPRSTTRGRVVTSKLDWSLEASPSKQGSTTTDEVGDEEAGVGAQHR